MKDRNLRKYFLCIVILAMLVAFGGCGGGSDDPVRSSVWLGSWFASGSGTADLISGDSTISVVASLSEGEILLTGEESGDLTMIDGVALPEGIVLFSSGDIVLISQDLADLEPLLSSDVEPPVSADDEGFTYNLVYSGDVESADLLLVGAVSGDSREVVVTGEISTDEYHLSSLDFTLDLTR